MQNKLLYFKIHSYRKRGKRVCLSGKLENFWHIEFTENDWKLFLLEKLMPDKFLCFEILKKSNYLWSDQIPVLLLQGSRVSNRLFYLSIPPNIFLDVVKCASKSTSSVNGWTRVIVEKPFGRDSESSAALTRGLKQYLVEDQIFRWYKHLPEFVIISGIDNLNILFWF